MVGGIETYLLNLSRICLKLGMNTTIYQWSNIDFEKYIDGICIKGVPVNNLPFRKRKAALYKAVNGAIDIGNDILIFGADHQSIKSNNPRHIAIQHGISWDLPANYLFKNTLANNPWIGRIAKLRLRHWARHNFENCLNNVCVDYNFLNWYRTTVASVDPKYKIWIVPNFAYIASEAQIQKRAYNKSMIRILFARRFVRIRGTRIMAEAARSLLNIYNNISFTFAGEGPEEDFLRKAFHNENRVRFLKYLPDDAINIHLAHDIAVVPSIASEGTSLAVAEAMATACPIIATATGGVTNMIISGYNGLLVMPNPQSLVEGLSLLINNASLRKDIGMRAYATSCEAFSITVWEKSWQRILRSMF
jgi:glycosyltransferase involved in cell wall biosynthesis